MSDLKCLSACKRCIIVNLFSWGRVRDIIVTYLEAVFCRFPCIVHLKYINNSHEVYFGAFTASLRLLHEKAWPYGEERRNLFVRKCWWLGNEREAVAQYNTSHLLSYLTTDWIPRSVRRGKIVDLEGEMWVWGLLAACPSPFSAFLPSAALHLAASFFSSLSPSAKMWNRIEYKVC